MESATTCAPTRATTRRPVFSMVIGWSGPGILGSRAVIGPLLFLVAGSSSGAEVELVALGVGECGSPVSNTLYPGWIPGHGAHRGSATARGIHDQGHAGQADDRADDVEAVRTV